MSWASGETQKTNGGGDVGRLLWQDDAGLRSELSTPAGEGEIFTISYVMPGLKVQSLDTLKCNSGVQSQRK